MDPRFKLKYVKFCFATVYNEETVIELMKYVEDTLRVLYEEYQAKYSNVSVPSTLVGDSQAMDMTEQEEDDMESLKLAFRKKLEEEENIKFKSELDKYMSENCEKEEGSFDILAWWKVNSSKYKILSHIARDVFAIPVSTVASESTFSMGGRILDQYRSSLTPKLVECLICTKNWIRGTPLKLEENFEELKKIEMSR